MEDTLFNSLDSKIQLSATFAETETTILSEHDSSDSIITINGVFSNSRGTWIVLATNIGFIVFETKKSVRFLKQSAHNLFEVILLAWVDYSSSKCRDKHFCD